MEALIAAAVSLAAQLIERDDKQQAFNVLQNLKDRIGHTNLPLLEKAVAEQLGPSALAGLSADSNLVNAQMAALNKLQDVSDAGGFDLADQAALNKVGNRVARQETAGRNAITNNMAARGVGGSGAEFAMQLANNQASASRMGQEGLDLAGMAQRRALEAIMQRGRMAGDMRQQDWAERSQAARAKDEIDRYNASARERANGYNREISQRNFENIQRKQALEQGIAMPQYQGQRQDAERNAAYMSGTGAAVAKGINDYGQANGEWKDSYDEDRYSSDDKYKAIEDAWDE